MAKKCLIHLTIRCILELNKMNFWEIIMGIVRRLLRIVLLC